MKPWGPPPAQDVLETSWEHIFPDEAFAAVSEWHVQVIEKLVSLHLSPVHLETNDTHYWKSRPKVEDRLAMWRNKFAKTALSYLQDGIFSRLPNNSQNERATWCEWAISGENDLHHPFYYLEYESRELASVSKLFPMHFNVITKVELLPLGNFPITFGFSRPRSTPRRALALAYPRPNETAYRRSCACNPGCTFIFTSPSPRSY